MKSLEELAAAAAVTDTSTTQISELQGSQWKSEIIKFGEANRKFSQVAFVDESLVGSGDKTVFFPISTSHLTIDLAPSGGEGDVRDNTELTNLDTVSLTFSESDFSRGKVSISKQILQTSRVNLITQARYVLQQEIEQKPDEAVATALQDTSVTQRVYGGDATGVDTLASGDILTTDHIPDAMAQIEDDNFEARFLFLAPAQVKAFRKDSQFVNASEYGDNEIVLNGEIGSYLGLKIFKTTNAPAYANSATDTNETPTTWGAAGHVCPMIGTGMNSAPVAVGLAWKEKPTIDTEFEKDEALHKIYLDMAFKSTIIQPKAVSLIKVTDA